MSSLEERLSEVRREYSTLALGLSREESFKLILKEVNRSRFFLQEAVDSIPRSALEEFSLSHVNILQELTRESLIYVFAEQRTVLGRILDFLHLGEPPTPLREELSDYLSSYTETLAKLHGLVAVHKISELFENGYNEPN